jgi:ceramide glucosyltransferase
MRHGAFSGTNGLRPEPLHACDAISVLKPLCGAEPRLYANLRTFCDQTHPHFQLLFGISSASDPAVTVVKRLQREYSHLDITLVINESEHGINRKVSNLINLMEHARHGIIVIADSDIAVLPDYLQTVVAPLAADDIGIVTCLYRARRVGNSWARLGALFIGEWFVPSVHVARTLGSNRFGFGATLALRRKTFDAVGGFQYLRDCVADDFWLAERVRELGFHTHVSEVTVSTDVTERDLPSLWLRETRWLRTIRSVHPLGFAFLFITFSIPWLLTGFLLGLGLEAGGSPTANSAVDIVIDLSTSFGISARLLLHWRSARGWRQILCDLPLIPLRDLLLSAEWIVSAFGSHVMWRGARIRIVETIATSQAAVPDITDEH